VPAATMCPGVTTVPAPTEFGHRASGRIGDDVAYLAHR
jgi:hypothetical protein